MSHLWDTNKIVTEIDNNVIASAEVIQWINRQKSADGIVINAQSNVWFTVKA